MLDTLIMYVIILTIVVYIVAAIPMHVILSHAGIPIALTNNKSSTHHYELITFSLRVTDGYGLKYYYTGK